MYYSKYDSPLGTIYFYFQAEKLIFANFSETKAKAWLQKHFPSKTLTEKNLKKAYEKELNSYFQTGQATWDWPIELIGTPFQLKVWQEVRKIPSGQFATYKQIGEKLNVRAYQSIGQAVGKNPLNLIIPCHRILGTNWFGGYSGGVNRKRLLLELEKCSVPPNSFG